MLHNLEGRYGRIVLGPITEMDVEFLRIIRNNNKNFFIYSEYISEEQQKKWYNNYCISERDFMFVISQKNNIYNKIGTVALYNWEKIKGECEFGRIIIDKGRAIEKGLGYEATICACNIAFNQLYCQVVNLEVYEENIKALSLYKRVGFEEVSDKYIMGKKIVIMQLSEEKLRNNNAL